MRTNDLFDGILGLTHERLQKFQINLKGPCSTWGSELVVQPFSPTLLVEVEYNQYKYGGCLHLFKLCVWGEKKSSTCTCARSPGVVWWYTRALAGRGVVKYASARHSAWMVRWNMAPRIAEVLLRFAVFVFDYLVVKSTRYGSLIGFLIFQNSFCFWLLGR